MAVPFLVDQLGAGAQVKVEVAWGANVKALYSTWTWTDITTDVRISDGINVKVGRGDEAAFTQPASCTLTLSNATGAYSLGGQSPNYPNVRRSTPLRVMVDHDGNGTYSAVFIGYVDSWQPSWNQAATDAEVHVTASGILRRLAQFAAPVLSSLRRRLSTEANVAAYWPLEEGKLAKAAPSGRNGHPDARIAGVVDFADDADSFASTLHMPVIKFGSIAGRVPFYTFVPTTGVQFRSLLTIPENGTGMLADAVLFRLWLDSPTFERLDIHYSSGGSIYVKVYSGTDGTVVNTMTTATLSGNFQGLPRRLYLQLKQVGGNVDVLVGLQEPGGNGLQVTAPVAGTLGKVTEIQVTPDRNVTGLAVGHLVLQNTITSVFDDAKELNAYEGEVSFVRFGRLGTENGIQTTTIGDGTGFGEITDKMGEQRPVTLPTLIQGIQEVDRGVIYDGLTHGGLVFATRRAIETRAADITIDVGAGHLAGTLEPTDDDQGLLNRAVVSRQDGATAVFEDITGPLGTSAVGTYDSSLTIPVASDAAAVQYASWLVALGTVEGYRYPSISVDLAASPHLAASVLALRPGHRVDLTNLAGAAAQHPAETIRLVVQGHEQTLTPFSWRVTLTCTPYGPWGVGVSTNADGTPAAGRTNGDALRADTSGAQLAAAASIGATSLSVATTAGPLWTTNAQDFPLQVKVGGFVVTVTAISGASSPQTFTVSGVTKALAAASPVLVHEPQSLGL